MASKQNSGPSQSQPQPASEVQHLELPTPTASNNPRPRHVAPTTPAHLLPATALFTGPRSHNASNLSLTRGSQSREDRSTGTPIDRAEQHLPRPHPPTSSFSGVPRPSLIGEQGHRLPRASHKTPPNNLGGQQATTASTTGAIAGASSKRDEEFRADAVWAEMQKTLADVELSAMNSSHVFSAAHVSALEELGAAQIGLAGAWARSEAVEGEGGDEEFGRDEGPGVGGAMGLSTKDSASPKNPGANARGGGNTHSRQGSTASSRGGNLEEETERDIKLARKRREANDRYFRQVNGGVLDVVKRLEEVVGAMRRVEKESREIWESSENENNTGNGSGNDSEDLGVRTETDESVRGQRGGGGKGDAKRRSRAGTMETTTDSEGLTDSPVETKRS